MNETRGEGQVYNRRDLLLDLGGGELGERFEDELGLEDALAVQTAARCGPWQLAHLWAKQQDAEGPHNDPDSRICR